MRFPLRFAEISKNGETGFKSLRSLHFPFQVLSQTAHPSYNAQLQQVEGSRCVQNLSKVSMMISFLNFEGRQIGDTLFSIDIPSKGQLCSG